VTRTRQDIQAATDPYRLLAGWADSGRAARFTDHCHRYGPLPDGQLVDAVDAAGLRGRGGAGFPTGRKLRAVAASGRGAVVIANGCEGEPASDKDYTLLTLAPHLVIDGAILAAHAVGATDVVLCVHRDDELVDSVTAALRERPMGEPHVRLVGVPPRYVASEESALVHFVNSGDARPTSKPPRPFERGVDGRPTLVDNVETLAHIALIARYGPAWFRGCGTEDSPGTAMLTVSGAVTRPGVYEAALGIPLGAALRLAGGLREPVHAVLVGGYGGTWLPLPAADGVRLAHRELRAAGASLGVGSLVVLPATTCGIAETAHVLRYLAGESAAQCGPCMFGLPAIAEDFQRLVVGAEDGTAALHRLQKRLGVISGRGACAHPDGAVRLAASALRTFGTDLRHHAAGHPCRWAGRTTLPIPGWHQRSGGWR
jgi:NADH:ubiquinone oxidoreductase subunit F (NADH-binding)